MLSLELNYDATTYFVRAITLTQVGFAYSKNENINTKILSREKNNKDYR